MEMLRNTQPISGPQAAPQDRLR